MITFVSRSIFCALERFTTRRMLLKTAERLHHQFIIVHHQWENLVTKSTKSTKWHVRPAKTQIRLGTAQSDQSLRCRHEKKVRVLSYPLSAREDSDQTGRRLIWVIAGRTIILLFCHEAAQIMIDNSVAYDYSVSKCRYSAHKEHNL